LGITWEATQDLEIESWSQEVAIMANRITLTPKSLVHIREMTTMLSVIIWDRVNMAASPTLEEVAEA
jgi:hypothetical protein